MSLTSLLQAAQDLLAQQVDQSGHNLAMGGREKKQILRHKVLKTGRFNGCFHTFVRCYLRLHHAGFITTGSFPATDRLS